MTTELRFALLGPVRLWRDGREIPAGSPQQQAVLVALLLQRGHPATADELIHLVWGEQPPATALGTTRTYVSRLRRLLAGTSARIDSVAGGYALRGEDLSVDVWDLQAVMARVSGQDPEEVTPADRQRLSAMLAAWPGTALEGVPGAWAEAQRVRLDGLRVAATETLMTARLLEGGPTVSELDALIGLVQAHPLDEGLRALLMLTLHRAGRRAEALEVFQAGRRLLREELGLSPGPALREAQQQILQDDRAPAALPETGATGEPVVYLPVALTDFTGRQGELATLQSALAGPGAVAGVAGMGGSGRTALVVFAAHRLAARFPDGQVYCDMSEAGGVAGVLAQLLRLLGGELPEPAGVHARAAALNALAAGRHLLLVLDNVRAVDDIHLLRRVLPAATLLFTSLPQFHGTADITWLRLRALSRPECLALFEAVAGPERVAAAPHAFDELAALSGGYPLAVRVFAQRVRDLGQWSVAAISQNMSEEMAHPYPSGHDDCALLAAPVERTHEVLPPVAGRILRVLGVLPDHEVSAAQLAEMLMVPTHQVFFALAAGADLSLLDENTADHHYRLAGPVVRTVMMRLAYAIEGPDEVVRLRARYRATSAGLRASA